MRALFCFLLDCFRTPSRHAVALMAALAWCLPAQADLSFDLLGDTAKVVTPGLAVTGSVWQRCPVGMVYVAGPPERCTGNATLMTYEEALAYVKTLNAGKIDPVELWQIPSAEFLSALLPSSIPSPLPTPRVPLLDTAIFPDTPIDDVFWSATPLGAFPLMSQGRLTMDYASGSSTYRSIHAPDQGYLRLVRPALGQLREVRMLIADPATGNASPPTGTGPRTANLVFQMTEAPGYELTEVAVTSGDCLVDELSSLLLKNAYVTLGSDPKTCEVTATFTLRAGALEITSSVTPAAGGTLKCPAYGAPNDTTHCEATPAAGYALSHFTGCDRRDGNTCFLDLATTNRSVTAIFQLDGGHTNVSAVPALETWGVVTLGALLSLGGACWMRRRASSHRSTR